MSSKIRTNFFSSLAPSAIEASQLRVSRCGHWSGTADAAVCRGARRSGVVCQIQAAGHYSIGKSGSPQSPELRRALDAADVYCAGPFHTIHLCLWLRRGTQPAGRTSAVPLLDILQSVPVLGFFSVTVTAFIALFRGSLLGLEAASIFAIFTGQAWNMTFSLYQSLRSVPKRTG